jgi:hypothetical protein
MVAIEMLMKPDIYFLAGLSYMLQEKGYLWLPLLHALSLAFNRNLASIPQGTSSRKLLFERDNLRGLVGEDLETTLLVGTKIGIYLIRVLLTTHVDRQGSHMGHISGHEKAQAPLCAGFAALLP